MDDIRQTVRAIDAATGIPRVPDHADLRRLLAYWSERHGDRSFPRRQDIDPVDLAFMLSRIALTEVYDVDPRIPAASGLSSGGGNRFYRFRIVGTWWRDIAGMEMTGLWADDFPNPRMMDITVSFYEQMLAAGRPYLTNRDAWIAERRLNYQILLLPLSEDGRRISMIMTGIGPRDG